MQILTRTLAAAVLLAAGAAHAQTKPDLSGTWQLNPAKSDFGQMPAPSNATMVVTQSATSIKLVQSMAGPAGTQSNTQEFALDGQEKTITGMDGQPAMSTGKIDSGMVMIDIKANRQGADIRQAMRFVPSPDGKSMTLRQEIATPMGALTMKLVFDKKD